MKKKPSKEKSVIIKKVKKMNFTLKSGEIIKGKVSGIEPYGIFVNCEEGYSGLIHISEVSDRFVKDISEYAQIDEIIPCKILEINHNTKKIKLSIKDLEYHLKRNKRVDDNFLVLYKMLSKWTDDKLKEINNN